MSRDHFPAAAQGESWRGHARVESPSGRLGLKAVRLGHIVRNDTPNEGFVLSWDYNHL